MDSNVLVELKKVLSDNNYEKTIVYKNGIVEFEVMKDGISSKTSKLISFVDELELQLIKAYDIMRFLYNKEDNLCYIVLYNNYCFYNFDLYIDINMMIKANQIRTLSVLKKHEKEKVRLEIERKKAEDIIILDEMEKNKHKIDLSDVVSTMYFNNNREIISFELKEHNGFELGQSRFFSDTIDIADSVEIPNSLYFVGQLNLSEFAKYDINNLLPVSGMLYFFQSPVEVDGHFYEFGKVIYSSDMNLKRKSIKIKDGNEHMVLNYSLEKISNFTENFNERYEEYNGEYSYHSFAGEDLNKIYGFYTDCQMSEEDIKKISLKYVVLLQLGSDIYGEGITTFLISEDDLKNKNFDNVIFKYSQS